MAVGPTILQSPLFIEIILPFLLVFTVVFGVLQKSEILGKGKKQIDAIVALVVGLIVVAFANYVGVIVQLVAFLGVSLVVLLVFMLLWGMSFPAGKFEIPKGVKWAIGIIVTIAVVIALIYFTGFGNYVYDSIIKGNNVFLVNAVMIVIIIVVVIVVVSGKGGSGSDDKKD